MTLTHKQLTNKKKAILELLRIYSNALDVTYDKKERKELWKEYEKYRNKLKDVEKQLLNIN